VGGLTEPLHNHLHPNRDETNFVLQWLQEHQNLKLKLKLFQIKMNQNQYKIKKDTKLTLILIDHYIEIIKYIEYLDNVEIQDAVVIWLDMKILFRPLRQDHLLLNPLYK
jgi:hypothetical protein